MDMGRMNAVQYDKRIYLVIKTDELDEVIRR